MRMTVVWADANGDTRATLLTTAAGATAVMNEIQGVTNAVFQQNWEGPLATFSAPPIAAQFQSVRDWAILTFATSVGGLLTITVPAPIAAMFKADLETVDPAAIAALIAQVISDVVDINGNPVVSYVGGVRVQSKGTSSA